MHRPKSTADARRRALGGIRRWLCVEEKEEVKVAMVVVVVEEEEEEEEEEKGQRS